MLVGDLLLAVSVGADAHDNRSGAHVKSTGSHSSRRDNRGQEILDQAMITLPVLLRWLIKLASREIQQRDFFHVFFSVSYLQTNHKIQSSNGSLSTSFFFFILLGSVLGHILWDKKYIVP